VESRRAMKRQALKQPRSGSTAELDKFAIGLSTILCCAVLVLAAGMAQTSSPRDALWQIVSTMCVPDQTQHHDPKPCSAVDLRDGDDRGVAILKDIRGETQFLLIPTARISGMESPEVLAPDAANYFGEAWEARSFVSAALHQNLPPDDISLAINSLSSRSQDQLHIHIDCVRTEVYDALHGAQGAISGEWKPLPHPLFGHPYKAMWVAGEHLGAKNPFKLLADGVPGARQSMGDYTLVVVGLTRPDGSKGFVLLEDQVNREAHDLASGEELQDHSCRIGRQ
jgi:CDP-diacylglycerol pyrophosphatase